VANDEERQFRLRPSNYASAGVGRRGTGFVNSDPQIWLSLGLVENSTTRGVFFTQLEFSS
jgi:hypothetical protein